MATTGKQMIASSYVKSIINKHQVVIFAKSWCPYCIRVKALFAANEVFDDVDVKIYDLDAMDAGASIQKELYRMTSQATVPSVWVNGVFMGGNNETQKAWRTGELSARLGRSSSTSAVEEQ